MAFEVGQLVQHPTLGLGKVVRVTRHVLKVFFKDESVNPKEISTSYAQLKVAAQQTDPWLDRLDVDFILGGKATKFLTQQQAIDRFLRIFPKAFSDPQYFERERNYKWAAHELWNELLSKPSFDDLLATGDYTEITQRAFRVEGSTNLLATFEKIALRNAVNESAAAERFAIGLFDLVYGGEPFQSRFEAFTRVLDVLPHGNTSPAKWPIQTIFPFLALPSEHVFLKPTVTKQAAERRAFSLNYKPQPNWLTYSCLLRLTEMLKADLADYKPRDMIDVQSFLWVTGEGTYGDA